VNTFINASFSAARNQYRSGVKLYVFPQI